MKYCPRCETRKRNGAFYRDAKRGDGLSSRCKECLRTYMAGRMAERRARLRQSAKKSKL